MSIKSGNKTLYKGKYGEEKGKELRTNPRKKCLKPFGSMMKLCKIQFILFFS